MLSLSEQRTLQFYEFDYRLRGYYLADVPVNIEPPFAYPFTPLAYQKSIDDGRVPNIFKQIGKLFNSTENKNETVKQNDSTPTPLGSVSELKGFSFYAPKGVNTVQPVIVEYINQLLFTANPISFEIIATSEYIRFQLVCDENVINEIQSQTKAFFPQYVISEISVFDLEFDLERTVGIADFGLENEVMLPLKVDNNSSFEPLTSFIATLDNLGNGETAMLQLLFKGVSAPFALAMNEASHDGQGGSFFTDVPELPRLCKEKTAYPLFSCVVRVVAQSNSDQETSVLTDTLLRNITSISSSEYNRLIPLSNKGYEYRNGHLKNVYYRQSNRLGCLLSSREIATMFHFPSAHVVSNKLHPHTGNTKPVKPQYTNRTYVLGYNEHQGAKTTVSVDRNSFDRHLFITGASGNGKSHLLKQLCWQSIQQENVASVILDPHGDLASDIISNITEENKDDIVFVDVTDSNVSFGFNIFSAETEAEKAVLASDLQKVFQSTFVSSGDRINSVLQKTISTLVYSDKEASILDIKRFLVEEQYRNEYLDALENSPILEYYWRNEYPLVKRHEIAPLLLRIDSYLQTRLLQNFFGIRKGLNIRQLIKERKTIVFNLSVGKIGLQNSKFIADLLVSKITQIAFSRSELSQEERHPIHLFIDEAYYYANTENIEMILSGARKYSLSLFLVGGQHLDQFNGTILNSILTNTAVQLYFRLSSKDARRIAPSFSHFEAEDFMELERGEVLVKIDKRSNDFNLKTFPIEKHYDQHKAELIREYIIRNSRAKYGVPINEVQQLIQEYIPKINVSKEVSKKSHIIKKELQVIDENQKRIEALKTEFKKQKEQIPPTNFETQKEAVIKQVEEQETIRKHRSLQNYVRTMAQQRGFKATFEQKTNNGGRVDVALLKNDIRVAIEVSITNTPEYEVKNIQKNIDDGFSLIYIISDNVEHLQNIKKLTLKTIAKKHHHKLHFFQSVELAMYLDATEPKAKTSEKRIRGYRVKVNYNADGGENNKQKSITDIIMKALRKK